MKGMARDYTTWKNDFLSDRWELFGTEGEMIAAIDKATDNTKSETIWSLLDYKGNLLSTHRTLEEAKTAAGKL